MSDSFPWLAMPQVQRLGHAFSVAGFELRFVGGCVRDAIMGRAFNELDAATNATPNGVMELLEKSGIRAIPTGLAHGTVTALIDGLPIEITTLRKDVSTDGRHAEVAYTQDWEEDARRRDFTMNALYVGLDGTLYDPVNGLTDCKAGRVRFIGDAAARIQEDYLRILRYFRFVATLGNHEFDDVALAACAAHKCGISGLSGERIAVELLKLLATEHTSVVMEKLLPLLPPELSFPHRRESSLAKLEVLACQPNALLKFSALIAKMEDVPAVAKRLALSSKQSASLTRWLSGAPGIHPHMSVLEQKKLVRRYGADDYLCLIQLSYAFSDAEWNVYAPLVGMAEWQPPVFPITAKDLMERGFVPGKVLGDKLREVEKCWEESEYMLSKDILLKMFTLH